MEKNIQDISFVSHDFKRFSFVEYREENKNEHIDLILKAIEKQYYSSFFETIYFCNSEDIGLGEGHYWVVFFDHTDKPKIKSYSFDSDNDFDSSFFFYDQLVDSIVDKMKISNILNNF